MRLPLLFLLLLSPSVNAYEQGCQDPSGIYISKETGSSKAGVTLTISSDLEIKVVGRKRENLFLGQIINFDTYKVSEYNNFANSPEVKSNDIDLGKWAILHIGEGCQYVKMVWFLGDEFKKRKLNGLYFFEKDT